MTGGRFPDFVHMASVTYVDVIVFNERIESRPLFHGVVHAVQIEILGFERYVDLYVRGFVKNLSWLAIPLEDQAYKLDARFAEAPGEIFSVEEEIQMWLKQANTPRRIAYARAELGERTCENRSESKPLKATSAKKAADDGTGRPRKIVPIAAVHDCSKRMRRIVDDADRRTDGCSERSTAAILKTNGLIARIKFDNHVV